MNLTDLLRSASHAARRAAPRTFAAVPFGARHHCCLCGRRVRRFLPYRPAGGTLPLVLRNQDVVGSDTDNFECPVCGCHDRERHLFHYLQASGLKTAVRGARILHFAPERQLQRKIAALGPEEYVLADLHPTRRHVVCVDITSIGTKSNYFDLVIANHVLEHVSDDSRALSEILRVLRPGGYAVLQTPYSTRLSAKFEDAQITDAVTRLEAYGQEDHCRLYGADLPEFICGFGFIDRTATHAALLPHIDPKVEGVNVREPLLLFSKPFTA